MGYGLVAAGGLDAAQQGLRQRVFDQLAQRKQQQDMAIQLREQALREQEAQQRAELMKQGQADRLANQQAITEDRGDREAMTAFTMTPRGGTILPRIAGRMRNIGLPVTDVPGIAAMAQGEGGQDVRTQMTPDSFQRGATQADLTADRTSELANRRADEAERHASEMERIATLTAGRQEAARVESERHNRAMENKPGGVSIFASETGPLRVDKGSGVATPVTDKAGNAIGPKLSGSERTRLDSSKAVLQTGDDIVANLQNPDFAAKLGPALGRYNSLRDFIGDPPPEFSELAGQIESYALANMGVHGMRSVAGSEKIKALLDGHHTPESMIGAIKGLNGFSSHFVENKTGAKQADTGGKKRTRYDLEGNVIK